MRWMTVIVVLVCWLTPVTSGAQPADEASSEAASSKNEAAIEAGRAALEHYENGAYEQALAGFEKAEGLYHTPVFLLYIARCQRALGRLIAARQSFERVLGETLDESAPGPWKQAKVDARNEHAEVLSQIPELTVTTNVVEATVTVDGKTVTTGTPLALDPGVHEVVATHETQERRRSVTLVAGADQTVSLTFETAAPPPPPVVPSPAPKPEGPIELPPPAPKESDTTSGLATAGYVLSGLGVVGLITGAITGGVALSENAAAGELCDEATGLCQLEAEEHEDRAFNLAHTSTASFAIGGAALLTGIILIIVDATDDDDAATSWLTPRGVTLRF